MEGPPIEDRSPAGGETIWKGSLWRVGLLVIVAFMTAEASLALRAYWRYGGVGTPYIDHSAKTGRALIPNTRIDAGLGTVTINGKGFRGGPFGDEPEPGVFRIAFLGSSVVFGGTVDDELVMPAQLEQLLNEREGPGSVEVINAGVPGWTAEGVLEDFERNVAPYKPTLVIVYPVINDLAALVKEDEAPAAQGPASPLARWWQSNSMVHNLGSAALGRWHPRQASTLYTTFPEMRGAEHFVDVYRRFAQQLRDDDVELILTTAAYPFRDDVALSDQQRLLGSDLWGLGVDETRRAYEALNAAVRQTAAEERVRLIDLAAELPHNAEYFRDAMHFTPSGAHAAARIIAASIAR